MAGGAVMETVYAPGLRTMQEMRMMAAYFRWRQAWERWGVRLKVYTITRDRPRWYCYNCETEFGAAEMPHRCRRRPPWWAA